MKRILPFILLFILICSPCWGGISLDGADDHCFHDSVGIANLEPPRLLTACAWAKRNGASESSGRIICRAVNDGASGPFISWCITTDADSDTDIHVFTGFASGFNTGTAVTVFDDTTTWHHVCQRIIADSDSTVIHQLYVDGVQVASDDTAKNEDIIYEVTSGDGDTLIGCGGSLTGTACGAFDVTDFVFYNIDLADAQILQLAAKSKRIGLNVKPSNLQMIHPLDEHADGDSVDGGTYHDISGNGYNFTCDNGGNNTGMTAAAEEILSYP